MEKIRFALVGCGNIAKKHAHVIKEYLDEAELAVVCDIDRGRAEAFGENNNVLTKR